jgi:hypothetical protein
VTRLAPFLAGPELMELLRAHEQAGEPIDPELIVSLAPFLPQEEISRLVRQHLEQSHTQVDAAAPQSSAAAVSPVTPNERDDRSDERRRMAELDSRIDELLTRLRDDDLSGEDRSRLIDDVSRVGGERAALRRQLEQG